MLTVRGRKSGLPRSTPVAVAEISGRRWLLSPFGETEWAKNVRAAGRATLTSSGRREEVAARELDRDERVAFYRDVLEPYLATDGVAKWIVRNVDRIPPDPVVAAAESGPVFELRSA
ncbi:MAG: nitroreductase family deazaflavin-dependent oxidoreductase [Chloroflexota bacterium]|nr:nitroreductase family deazaflavin-dependent oxidoreductase [Chloroflexota bacterium]